MEITENNTKVRTIKAKSSLYNAATNYPLAIAHPVFTQYIADKKIVQKKGCQVIVHSIWGSQYHNNTPLADKITLQLP